jgi:competence protein ComEA
MFRRLIVACLAAFALNAFAAVEINRASRAELETVKGIGPGLSAKIMKEREAGEFKDWADMVKRVPGVGAASADKLSKAGLTVGGSGFDAKAMPQEASKERKPGKKSEKGDKAAGKPEKAAKTDKPAA